MHLDVAAAAAAATVEPACSVTAVAHAHAASTIAASCASTLHAWWAVLWRLLQLLVAQLALWKALSTRISTALRPQQQTPSAVCASSIGALPAQHVARRWAAAPPPPQPWAGGDVTPITAHLRLAELEARRGRLMRSCPLPLPPPAREHEGKLTVCLDLDETLLCSYWLDELPSWLRPQLHAPSTALVHYGPPDEARSTLVVLERPGMRVFLVRAAALAELVLFTAGAASYALPIARHVDPSGELFRGRMLFRDATVGRGGAVGSGGSGERGGGGGRRCAPVKDLSRLGRPLTRTVLVDNSASSFLLQPANGVPCRPFRGADGDAHLLGVILPLLASLALVDDVRPCLDAHFKLAAWFRSKGLPVADT